MGYIYGFCVLGSTGMCLDILRQWRVDIKPTRQKTFLRNLGDDEFKDYSGGLSMSR